MQITQERWEYDLTTNSVKFMQHAASSFICQKMTVMFVTNSYCITPTWWIVRKLKQVLKTSISDTNTSWQTFTPFTGAGFIIDSAAAHVIHQWSTASVRWHHGCSSECCCIILQIL